MKFACAAFFTLILSLQAHVGSPDIFFDGNAGPYPLSIVIRPPEVIPGVAEVEILTSANDVTAVQVVPFPLVGLGSKYPPTPDFAKRSPADSHSFTSSVWLMATGSYQVRLDVDGARGHGTLSIPVPSIARNVKNMNSALGWMLALLMVLIVAGAVSIAGAAARESTLGEGESPGPSQNRRSRVVMASVSACIIAVLALGNWWWNAEANSYRAHIYQPPAMQADLEGGTLHLRLENGGWAVRPKLNDFLPDHGHLMHLFVVRMPEMDRMWHLHPSFMGNGEFTDALPSIPAGHYKLFADVVHASGFPETPVADLNLSTDLEGAKLNGDDAEGSATPLSLPKENSSVSPLSGGYRMLLQNPNGPLIAKQMQHLSFEVQDRQGQPATDLEPYMGMAGHAEFLLSDASVFAHVHPSGTVPMAALGLTAEGQTKASSHTAGMSMSHMRGGATIPAQLSFPFGFPKAGRYRMFIQIQRAGSPETASFDFIVSDQAK